MKLTVKWTKDFSFTQSSRRGTQCRRHAAAYSGARFMRAMRVIYYGSIMKISLPLDIVPKHAVPDTPGGHCRRHQLAPPSGRGLHLHAWHRVNTHQAKTKNSHKELWTWLVAEEWVAQRERNKLKKYTFSFRCTFVRWKHPRTKRVD